MKIPNILQITTHDTGRHFGCYGHPTLHTPAVDALAADGVRLTNLFCTAPICSPARCSLLTGLHPQQHGVMDLVGPRGWALYDPSRHLAARLRAEAGFATALIGTHHEIVRGKEAELGFDEIRPGTAKGRGRPSAPELAAEVRAWFQERAAEGNRRPFYLQVGLIETHTPFDFGGAQPDVSRGVELPAYLADDEGNRRRMAAFQGAVRQADAGIGAMLEALRESGLEEETLVVVTTDHGIEMPRAKWELHDPGLEVAMVVRCPALGLTGGRTVGALLSGVDYLPTLMELISRDPGPVAGRSFAGLLKGESQEEIRDAVFASFNQRGNARAVRTRRHKLIRFFNDYGIYPRPVASDGLLVKSVSSPVLLFDLEGDPHEFCDLSANAAYQPVREELETRLWQWMEEVGDPLLRGPWETPTYRRAMADYQAWSSRGSVNKS
ncbi:MAG TPA: sulfatase [Chthoniobacteraceae bacterium]|nr:sulfatase [Chthoniobacteraceae bacterium]